MNVKSDKEVATLKKFLSVCPEFSSKTVNIKSCIPNEPDCFCEFSGNLTIYFELSEIIDQSIAQKFNDPKLLFTGGFFGDEILTDRIKDKFTKTYQTNGKEIELLLYFDLQPTWPEATMIDQIKGIIDGMGKEPFRRVWLFSVPKSKVIAKY